ALAPAAAGEPAVVPASARGASAAAAAPGPAPAAPAPQEAAASDADAPALDLERLGALWPAVADAVRADNGMVGALLADARPVSLAGGRLTLAFPADAAFSKKKAETNRELVHGALRAITGQPLSVIYELSGEPAAGAAATLSEEELLARLLEEFGAHEILEDDHDEGRA
ncbi:MAG: hypothetical protein ACM3UV_07500, partial [Nocardioidaceae bacterium]